MRAINATIMRHMNRTLVLNQIRLRPISRAELAEETGLTRASITQIVDELISEGLVIETSIIGRTRLGRRSTQLAIHSGAGAFFGINLEKDQCTVGAVDLSGKVLKQNTELVAGRTPDEVLDAIADTILAQMDALALKPERVYGVGMSVPGSVDSTAGKILSVPGMDAWSGVSAAALLSDRLNLSVALESEANALALEEKYFGCMGDTFALIHVADTVSVGVVVRGALYHGLSDFPAELGQCPADGGQCLDELISLSALLKDSGCRTWNELMLSGDSEAVIDRLAAALKPLVLNIIHAFRLNAAVISGPMGHCTLLRDRLNESVRAACRFPIESGPVHPCTVSIPIRMSAAPALQTVFQG